MCGWVLKQPGILKFCDFLALREGGVRKQWRGGGWDYVCAALFKWSGRAQRVIGATEGREEGSSCSRRHGTSLVWPSEGQWVRITPGRGGLRRFVCPCCWHKVSTLFPCHLHAAPCSVVQLPIVPGEHPPVALGRGLERRLGHPPDP